MSPHISAGIKKLFLSIAHGFLSLLLIAILFPMAGSSQPVYTFDNLNLNVIQGQDNWLDQAGLGVGTIVLDTTPINMTNVAIPVLSLFYLPAFISRVNDSAFNFPQFAGNETDAIMQFEARGSYVALFSLGYDINADGSLDTSIGEVGPSFGIWDQQFGIQAANLDTLYLAAFGSGNSVFEWFRIQLRIDFTANGGQGSGSLYYLNLTDGGTSYIAVPGLQNVNLFLDNMNTGASPQNWNSMHLLLMSSGGVQTAVDNLIPNAGTLSSVQSHALLSGKYYLDTNFPNPFRSSTLIKYFLPAKGNVKIEVFNQQGKKVETLIDAIQPAGEFEVSFDGSNLPAGVYHYHLVTDQFTESKKMVHLN